MEVCREITAPTAAQKWRTKMDDLISRQWLMDCVNEGWIKFDTEKDKNRFIHLVRDIAPSAEPEWWCGIFRCQTAQFGFCHLGKKGGGTMEELKRCPFCGSEARYYAYTDGGVCVRCLKCGCQTEAMSDMTIAQCREHNSVEAITMKWNRRVDNGSESETR
jgi:hypothetical protein